MFRIIFALLLVFFSTPCVSALEEGEGQQTKRLKRRVAVFKFEDKTGQAYSWWGGRSLGEGMSDMLVTELVKSGNYRVLERQEIEDVIMKEQALGQSGIITPESATQIGKMLGVELAIVGSVTEYGAKEAEKGGRIKGVGLGGKKTSATVAVDVRFVNTETGEIVAAEQVRKEKSATGLSITTSSFDYKDEKEFDDSLVGKATREAIGEIVQKVEAAAVSLPWQAKVAKVNADGSVIINSGADAGVQVGDTFVVYRKGEEIVDPDTGVSLGSEDTRVGTIQVVDNTIGKGKASKCKIVSGSGLQQSDLVRLK